MPFGLDDVAQMWHGVRRGNYKTLRDGKPIAKDVHSLPLFDEPDVSICAVNYVYWGRNQKFDGRLVKVGYTAGDLASYLKKLGRMYDPILMASRPGDKDDENAFHLQWRHFVADGKEWYWAHNPMFDAFRRDWQLVADFEAIAKEALQVSPFYGSQLSL
jgi:hypothetical protein